MELDAMDRDPTRKEQPGGPFDTEEEAAIAALKRVWKASYRAGKEFGGMIYLQNGKYCFSPAIEGEEQKVDVRGNIEVPIGGRATAYYHTHSFDPREHTFTHPELKKMPARADNFSIGDRATMAKQGINGYLSTPMGNVKMMDVKTNELKLLGISNMNLLGD
jgi:hypothetical protein